MNAIHWREKRELSNKEEVLISVRQCHFHKLRTKFLLLFYSSPYLSPRPSLPFWFRHAMRGRALRDETTAIHATLEKFQNATITGYFEFALEEFLGREIKWLPWLHRYRKASFLKCFMSTQDAKPAFSNFSDLKNVFEMVGLTVEIKLHF